MFFLHSSFPDPGDYISTTQVLTFGPGRAARVNVLILIVDDIVNEGIEQFFARLAVTDPSTDVDVELNPNQTIIEIIDNDCKIQHHTTQHIHSRPLISSSSSVVLHAYTNSVAMQFPFL